MPVKTRRWNDPGDDDDGFRLLVCRYRPRGLPRTHETWDAWEPDLGPSRELHRRYYDGGLAWEDYRRAYLDEMRARGPEIAAVKERLRAGETVTLLCSSACDDPARCHRTLLAELLLE
jgi:uncharacterized protein YeaO (DUF488 family)